MHAEVLNTPESHVVMLGLGILLASLLVLISAIAGKMGRDAIKFSALVAGLVRHFYREKYNAARILNDFARTARDQVELEQLQGAIHETVARTVQPATFSLWLADPAGSGHDP